MMKQSTNTDQHLVSLDAYRRLRRGTTLFIQGKLVLNLLWIILVLYFSIPSPSLILVSALALVPAADLIFLIPYYYGIKHGPRTMIALTYTSMAISVLAITWGLHLSEDFTGQAVIFYFLLLPVAGLVVPQAETFWAVAGFSSVAYLTLAAIEATGLVPTQTGRTPAELQMGLGFAGAVVVGLWIVAGLLGQVVHLVERQRKQEIQLYEEIRRATEEEIWRVVGRTIISSLDVDEVLTAVLKVINGKLQVATGSILLLGPENAEAYFAKILQGNEQKACSYRVHLGEGIAGWVLKNRQPALVLDAARDPRFSAQVDRPIGLDVRTILSVPLAVKGDLIGAIVLQNKQDETFTDSDLGLLESIATAVALAIKNARLFEDEQTRREELSALYGLSRALAEVDDMDAVLDLITRHAVESISITFARIAIIEEDALVIRAARPVRNLGGDLGVGQHEPIAALANCKRMFKQNTPIVLGLDSPDINDREREFLFSGLAQTLCLVPLGGEEPLGLLILGGARNAEREPFTTEKIRMARSIGDQAVSAIHRVRQYIDQERAYLETVLALSNAVEAKDSETAYHAQRLSDMALAVGREMEMGPRALEDLRYGAILHDVGKIGVDDSVLKKPARLEPIEWRVMRQHPVVGADILSPVVHLVGAAKIVRHHHERYDGRGYPDGLRGDEIPLGARILAVVDSYTAIRDKRVYKSARSHDEAVAELKKHAGTQFDPRVLEVFLQLTERHVARGGEKLPTE